MSIIHFGFPITFKYMMDFDTLSNPDQLVELGTVLSFCSTRNRYVRGTVRENSWTYAVSAVSPSISFIKSKNVELKRSSVAFGFAALHTSYTQRQSIWFGHS